MVLDGMVCSAIPALQSGLENLERTRVAGEPGDMPSRRNCTTAARTVTVLRISPQDIAEKRVAKIGKGIHDFCATAQSMHQTHHPRPRARHQYALANTPFCSLG